MNELVVIPKPGVAMTPRKAAELEQSITAALPEITEMPILQDWLAASAALERYLKGKELKGPALGMQRRIEARIGQLLGEAKPGPQPESSLVREVSRPDDRADFRLIAKAIALFTDDEWRTSRRALVQRARKKLGIEWIDTPADVSVGDADLIFFGDFRAGAANLDNDSVDLIFTDPPYSRDSLDLYADAADIATRVLRPGGSLIMYCGQFLMPDIINAAIEKGMRYWWTLACAHDSGGQLARMTEYGIIVHWKPMLWFVKGTRGDKNTFIDDWISGNREKDTHEWQQSVAQADYCIRKLTPDNGLVIDFFAGGGTTLLAADRLGRKCKGYETNPFSRKAALDRIYADRKARNGEAA